MNLIELLRDADRKLDHGEITIGEYKKMIAPLKDAVPVIRCGFCRYYNSVGYCALHQTEMSKTDFCSYGKKDGDYEKAD